MAKGQPVQQQQAQPLGIARTQTTSNLVLRAPTEWKTGRPLGEVRFAVPVTTIHVPRGERGCAAHGTDFYHAMHIQGNDCKAEMARAVDVWLGAVESRNAWVNDYRYFGASHEYVEMQAANSEVNFVFDRKFLAQVQMYKWRWHHNVVQAEMFGQYSSLNDYIRSIEFGEPMSPPHIQFLNGLNTDYRLVNLQLPLRASPVPNPLFMPSVPAPAQAQAPMSTPRPPTQQHGQVSLSLIPPPTHTGTTLVPRPPHTPSPSKQVPRPGTPVPHAGPRAKKRIHPTFPLCHRDAQADASRDYASVLSRG
jgi:hypothetical protein